MSRKIELENRRNYLKSQVIDLNGRATGRTTRLVDEYIQKIYNNPGEWIKIVDHYPSRKADYGVFDKVCGRLKYEHSSDEFKVRSMYGFEVKLVKCARNGVLDKMIRINKEIEDIERQIKEL